MELWLNNYLLNGTAAAKDSKVNQASKEILYIQQMLELEKELTTELQKIGILNNAINNLQNTEKRTVMAVKAISEMPETAKMFKPVGRM